MTARGDRRNLRAYLICIDCDGVVDHDPIGLDATKALTLLNPRCESCLNRLMTCDNCGASLEDRPEPYGFRYQTQALPPGETINGRSYIRVCPSGECIVGEDL